jgi:hypothetical protein
LKFAQAWKTDCCWCNNQKRKKKPLASFTGDLQSTKN